MPLAFQKPYAQDGCLGLWHIQEDMPALLHALKKSFHVDTKNFAISHPLRRKEWYASRLLLQALVQHLSLPVWGFRRNAHEGLTMLGNKGGISLAHAYPYALAAVHPHATPGVDIEAVGEQAVRVAGKFLSASEAHICARDPFTCTLFWAAKEAVFKAVPLFLRFKEDIQLSFSQKGAQKGVLLAHGPWASSTPICVHYETYAGHILTYTHVKRAGAIQDG